MSLFFLVILGLAMGLVFGIALEKARVLDPSVLVSQFRLENFTMLKMFLSAVITGLVVISALYGFGLASLHPKSLILGQAIVGGLLLGAGIVVAGACPGTALGQIGAGYKDAWATVAGGVLGALAYGYNTPFFDDMLGFGNFGKITLADVTAVPFWALALGLAAILAVVLVFLERWRPWRSEMPENPGQEDHLSLPHGTAFSAD